MKQIALHVKAISPLAIRADHAPGGAEKTKYIPGTALVGSLAAVHRLYHPDDSENFERLFLKGWVQYPDLYPAAFDDEEESENATFSVYPLPRTAESCKRFSGFSSTPSTQEIDE